MLCQTDFTAFGTMVSSPMAIDPNGWFCVASGYLPPFRHPHLIRRWAIGNGMRV